MEASGLKKQAATSRPASITRKREAGKATSAQPAGKHHPKT
jgi:hypothetical protein